jgi:SH3-like domain-containing protein
MRLLPVGPFALAAAALVSIPAFAADYRSLAEPAVTYDAPTLRGKKLFVAPKGMPVEVVVSIEGWQKVRDRGGDMMWVERKSLADKRTLVVAAPTAQVREKPDDGAKVVLEAGQNVLLDLVEPPTGGWAKVRHRDGAVGYLHINQVWGL